MPDAEEEDLIRGAAAAGRSYLDYFDSDSSDDDPYPVPIIAPVPSTSTRTRGGAPDTRKIKIRVLGVRGDIPKEIRFLIRMSTPIGVLRQVYADLFNIPEVHLVLVYKGRLVTDGVTPALVHMDDGDFMHILHFQYNERHIFEQLPYADRWN